MTSASILAFKEELLAVRVVTPTDSRRTFGVLTRMTITTKRTMIIVCAMTPKAMHARHLVLFRRLSSSLMVLVLEKEEELRKKRGFGLVLQFENEGCCGTMQERICGLYIANLWF